MNIIGSLFKRDYDIDKEIKTLYDELGKIQSLESMQLTQGWVDLEQWMEGRIDTVKSEIDGLLTNATKNGKEIEKKYWTCQVYRGLLNAVETTLKTKQEKVIKLKQLTETAELRELASVR